MDFEKLKQNWASPNKFSVTILETGSVKLGLDNDTINSALKNVTLPQYSDESIETYNDTRWTIARGRESIFQVMMTFRDMDDLKLYSAFLDFLQRAKNEYPEDQFVDITLRYEGNWSGDGVKELKYRDCIITNITDLPFDHSNTNSTLDFSVGFKTYTYEIVGVTQKNEAVGM